MVEDAVGAAHVIRDGVPADDLCGLVVHRHPSAAVHDHIGLVHDLVPVVAHGGARRQQDVAEILEISLEIPASPHLPEEHLTPSAVVPSGLEQGAVEPSHGQPVRGLQLDLDARVVEVLVLRFSDRIHAVEIEEPGILVRVVVDAVGFPRAQGHRGAAHDFGRAAVVGELHGVVYGDEDLFRVGVAVLADAAAGREDDRVDESPGGLECRRVEPRIEIARRGAAVADAEMHFIAPGVRYPHIVRSGRSFQPAAPAYPSVASSGCACTNH